MSEESSVATHLALDEYLTAIRSAAERLHDHAAQAGLTADVPSCPGWDVAALVAHQGMVHRWAAANVSGDSDHRTEDSEAAAAAAPDLLAWFDEGVHGLIKTLIEAPDDLEAMVFLRHAPPPRLFWARRQAHETTIHAVDAQSAALRRLPRPAEAMINDELAADGIDELLRGFLPRRRSALRSESPYVIEIRLTDADQRWQGGSQQSASVKHSRNRLAADCGDQWHGGRAVSGTLESLRTPLRRGAPRRHRSMAPRGTSELVAHRR